MKERQVWMGSLPVPVVELELEIGVAARNVVQHHIIELLAPSDLSWRQFVGHDGVEYLTPVVQINVD